MNQGDCGYCGRYVKLGDEHYEYGVMYHRRGGCARYPEPETPVRETPVRIKTSLRAFCRGKAVDGTEYLGGVQHEQCSGVSEPINVDGYWSVCSCPCHAVNA